jgi:hypothetical protein
MTLESDWKREKRITRRDFSASNMSDTKWRILFSAIEEANLKVEQIIVKFIDSPVERRMGVPGLYAGYAFVDSFEFGPISLVSIEWLEFPKITIWQRGNNLPAKHDIQDIDAIRLALERTGKQFPIEESQTGFRIIGHKV